MCGRIKKNVGGRLEIWYGSNCIHSSFEYFNNQDEVKQFVRKFRKHEHVGGLEYYYEQYVTGGASIHLSID